MNIAIIPARYGSKRIKKKNIVNFFNKPLIYYAIKTAIKCKLFDRIIVSTDSKKIATISNKYGAQTPFLRPKKLSNDKATSSQVMKHALQWFEKKNLKFKYACMIYPTAPQIKIKDLKIGLKNVKNGYSYSFSAAKYSSPIQRSFTINKKFEIKKMLNKKKYFTNSQDLENYYFDAGQFYWGNTTAWKKNKKVFSNESKIVEVSSLHAIDINTYEDLLNLKKIYKIL